jgi:uncharacterized protein
MLMHVKRLIVAGAVGAGKSTFVRTVSDIGVISTEEIATDETASLKPTTTVALDFNRVTLPTGILHVYGTPGQFRFRFMGELLLQRADVVLVLVAAHRPNRFGQSRQILTFVQQQSTIPITIGFTHVDCPDALAPAQILDALGYSVTSFLWVSLNPLDRDSVLNALTIATDGVFRIC